MEQAEPTKNVPKKSFFKKLFQVREIGVLAALAVLVFAMSWLSPYFLKSQNLFNVLRSMSTIGIMAIGMLLVLVSGGIDISFAAIATVSQYVMALFIIRFGGNIFVALAISIIIGTLLGMINGLLIYSA